MQSDDTGEGGSRVGCEAPRMMSSLGGTASVKGAAHSLIQPPRHFIHDLCSVQLLLFSTLRILCLFHHQRHCLSIMFE